eukprot:GHRR01029556.1.p1 GENE.GHRR01029556.1~~GHRR01029556.1.p1  ORF type:complete len:239 (+),score=51.99 GHRR01029556.1:238-954(+)
MRLTGTSHSQARLAQACPPPPRRRVATCKASTPTGVSEPSSNTTPVVHDGRVPLLQTLEQFVRPKQYIEKVLSGHKWAWGRGGVPPKECLYMADPTAARTWLNSEDQLGIKTQYPYAFRTILGDTSIAMVQNPELHQRLRQIMLPYFTTDAIQRLVPDIQATVQKHLARWAAADKPVSAYKGAKKLTFDVMANHALQLGLSDAEVDEYSEVYKTMVDGFKPPAINLPFTAFGKGLKAR